MMKYKCIKEVEATEMTYHEAGELGLIREYSPSKVEQYGYKVVYKDGYESWSPKDVFEDGYIMVSDACDEEKCDEIEPKDRDFLNQLRIQLDYNGNKISPEFIDKIVEESDVMYFKLSNNTRVCLLTTATGEEVVGIAQVLDSRNDVEEIGNKIAFNNAKDQLWSKIGSIAKMLIGVA